MSTEMQTAQRALETARQNHAQAKVASAKAKELLDNYMVQVRRKTGEAMQLIAASKQAQMQERLAQTMSSFQVGDDSQTFDDMREKIANRAAAAEAKAELAASSLDTRMQSIEKELAQIEAEDKLLAYKQQLGMLPSASGNQLPSMAAGNVAVPVIEEQRVRALESSELENRSPRRLTE